MSQSNNSFKNFVNNHKFIFATTTASLFLGIASLIGINIFSPAKRPFYSVKSFNLINNSSSTIENLDIKYKVCDENIQESECQLKEIESLTVTKIFLWNGGRIKIDKTDVDDNPITIVASNNHSILDTKIIHSSNKRTDFRLDLKSNTINFDFLDSSNGGVIQVLHTGKSDEDISLDGYVEDSKFDGQIKQEYLFKKLDDFIVIGTYFQLAVCVAFIIYHTLYIKQSKNKTELTISSLEKSLSDNNLSDEVKQSKSKKLEAYKNRLKTNNKYINFMYFSIIMSILLMITAFIQFSFKRLTLRYPTSSYEVFNSEITQ